jgi:hypothetical protein
MTNLNKKRVYIILSPGIVTGKSNGIRVLHYLSKELQNRGYEAYMYTPKPHSDEYNYISKITEEHKNNAIVIYPELISGNPLSIKNAVRWTLNKPGLLGVQKSFYKSELIFTWNKEFYKDVPVLQIPYVDRTIFYNDNSPKTQDCVFVYKKGKFRIIPELENLTEINMSYPETREELGALLRSTGTLYSYDDCTAIIDEARECGANVKIITKDDIIDAPASPDLKKSAEQIEYFIKTTQERYYEGPIQSPVSAFNKKKLFCLSKMLIYLLLNNKKKFEKYKNLLLLS